MNAWLALISSILCSVAVAHVLRIAKEKQAAILVVFLMNYGMAFLLAFVQIKSFQIPFFLMLLGILTGAVFIGNFFLFAQSVKQNGLGRSIVAMRVSMIVPILGSILLFKEQVHLFDLVGFVLIFVCLILISSQSNSSEQNAKSMGFGLLSLFLVSGFGDFSMKLFQSYSNNQVDPNTFISVVFGTAFLIAAVLVLIKKPVWKKQDIGLGLLLGIPNVFSSLFLVFALQQMQAVFVYPVVNSLVILIGTTVGIVYWKDVLSKKQQYGLGLALIAIFMLTLE